jgi:hypothetical protein
MKKQAYTMIAMIILVGSMAVAARAQTSGRIQLTASIPFQFNVGNKTLPAGEYTVVQVNSASGAILQIRSKDGRAGALVLTISVTGKTQESAKLIFRRYENRYFLAQAWVDGDDTGFETSKSRAERAAEREIAGIKAKTEAVALRNR